MGAVAFGTWWETASSPFVPASRPLSSMAGALVCPSASEQVDGLIIIHVAFVAAHPVLGMLMITNAPNMT